MLITDLYSYSITEQGGKDMSKFGMFQFWMRMRMSWFPFDVRWFREDFQGSFVVLCPIGGSCR